MITQKGLNWILSSLQSGGNDKGWGGNKIGDPTSIWTNGSLTHLLASKLCEYPAISRSRMSIKNRLLEVVGQDVECSVDGGYGAYKRTQPSVPPTSAMTNAFAGLLNGYLDILTQDERELLTNGLVHSSQWLMDSYDQSLRGWAFFPEASSQEVSIVGSCWALSALNYAQSCQHLQERQWTSIRGFLSENTVKAVLVEHETDNDGGRGLPLCESETHASVASTASGVIALNQFVDWFDVRSLVSRYTAWLLRRDLTESYDIERTVGGSFEWFSPALGARALLLGGVSPTNGSLSPVLDFLRNDCTVMEAEDSSHRKGIYWCITSRTQGKNPQITTWTTRDAIFAFDEVVNVVTRSNDLLLRDDIQNCLIDPRPSRVFVGGNYDDMSTLKLIAGEVKEAGKEPIVAATYEIDQREISEWDKRILHAVCSQAIFEVSLASGEGALIEADRAALDYGTDTYCLYRKRAPSDRASFDKITSMITSHPNLENRILGYTNHEELGLIVVAICIVGSEIHELEREGSSISADTNVPYIRSLFAETLSNLPEPDVSLQYAKKLLDISNSIGRYELIKSIEQILVEGIERRSDAS